MNKKHSPTYESFQIIRHRSNRDRAQLPDGTFIEKLSKLFVPEYRGFINATMYDDGHFIYEIPENLFPLYPGPIYRCTCGSVAIIVGMSGYVYGQSPQGLMWCCKHHSDFGKHATGGDRWI